MNVRTGIGVAFLAMVVIGLGGYFAGLSVGGGGLSEAQRSEVEELVAQRFDSAAAATITEAVTAYVAENPTVVGEASLDQTRFGARVREFLLDHPEVINEAIAELERKRIEDEAAARTAAIADNRDKLFESARQVVFGNPDGDVTLVEFFDYNCTYCRRAHGDMERLLKEDPQLRVVLKEFPVLGPRSIEAARIGIAVNRIAPEKYRAFHDRLLSGSESVGGEEALAVAEDLGIERSALETEVASSEVNATIEESYDLANALSLTGTPSYVVGNEVVVGAVGYDQLAGQIAAIRDCGKIIC